LLFLPHEAVERLVQKQGCFVNSERERNMDKPYDDLRIKFITEYDRANPITSHKAMAEYFRFIAGSLA
jgi:hypothetical protein